MNIIIEKKQFNLEMQQEARKLILNAQDQLSKHPEAVFGDSDLCPLKHSFADGQYVREMFIPKGVMIIGKIHKHSHPNFLLKGKVSVFTEHEGVKELEAPLSMISIPGTKRVVYAHEDTIWVTIHKTNKINLDEIEEEIIAKDFKEYDNLIGGG